MKVCPSCDHTEGTYKVTVCAASSDHVVFEPAQVGDRDGGWYEALLADTDASRRRAVI